MTKAKKVKTLRVGVDEAINDLTRKAKQLASFHEKGHPVRIELRLRGQRQAHRTGDALAKVNALVGLSEIEEKKWGPLKWAGPTLSMHVHP